MNLLPKIGYKRLVPVVASLILVLAIATVLGSREVHALVATLVQVVNTPNQPVPNRDVDNPANEPFAWEAISRTTPVNDASFTVPSTTADGRTVQRLVIEHVTALCSGLSTPTSGIRVSSTTGKFSNSGVTLAPAPEFFIAFPNNPVAGSQLLSQPVRIYADPGVGIFTNALDFETGGVCTYSAWGYLVVQ